MFQFNTAIRCLRKHMTVKEIHRLIIVLQQSPFLLFRHGCQLVDVAYHQHLHATERLVVVPHTSHHRIDGIEEVGAHHRYLVNHQQFQRADDFQFLCRKLLILNRRCATYHVGIAR